MLSYTPLVMMLTVLLGVGVHIMIKKLDLFGVSVGNYLNWDRVFFGAELGQAKARLPHVPIELLAAVFFLLIVLIFIGLGQVLGQKLNIFKDRIKAYSLNVGGSLAGILVFAVMSSLRMPAVVWFAISLGMIAYFLLRRRRLTILAGGMLLCCFVIIAGGDNINWISHITGRHGSEDRLVRYWSPYYRIVYDQMDGSLLVNGIVHQSMVPLEKSMIYSLPYWLAEKAGHPPFKDVLIIGAGAGNDVAHALANDVQHIDAVEIDPVILALGKAGHPNRPYDDPRVTVYIDDGRSFLHNSDKTYDLIVYALVDSLTLQSAYSSVRLESFLFTLQALEDVKSHLNKGGVFVVYNFFREGWIVSRLEQMIRKTFRQEPIIYTNPSRNRLRDTEKITYLATLMAGDIDGIRQECFLNKKLLPLASVHRSFPIRDSDDNWPFFYLKGPFIPKHNLFGLGIIVVLSFVVLKVFSPMRLTRLNPHFIFLGAGFMLIETKSVTRMAVLFGSTWMVNCVVFFAILIMILLSNLYVRIFKPKRLAWCYVALVLGLILNFMIPLQWFLSYRVILRLMLSSLVMFIPIFFAGIIFARSFSRSRDPNIDFGANIVGIVLGSVLEYASLVFGFQSLTVLAILIYLFSLIGIGRMSPVPEA